MELDFSGFLNTAIQNPIYLITVLFISGIVFSNGRTDAPHSIATSIATRSLSPKGAYFIVGIFGFLGIITMTLLGGNVASTIFKMVDFGGTTNTSLIALCSGLFSAIMWSSLATKIGMPTSVSHSLIAGISGAAIYTKGSIDAINIEEWKKVIYGIFLSILLGFFLGYFITKIIELIFKHKDRRTTTTFFKRLQIVGSSMMTFMDGGQDGQKYIGIFLLAIGLMSNSSNYDVNIPIWLMLACSIIMTIGACSGGTKIIKTVGLKMVKLEPYQGASADIASAISLFIANMFGMPVSVTHTKTSSIMGVGASKRISNVNWKVVKEMMYAWIFTFPICGILGYFVALVSNSIYSLL